MQAAVCIILLASVAGAAETARGVVFHDLNGNRQHDLGEPGIADVRVSNGREIVKTEGDGRYELPVNDDTIIFVIKPRNWMTPLSEHNLPRFYYVHKPNGSPPEIRKYPGVAPTGPLPRSVDFPLTPHPEPDAYDVLVFGDTQPRDLTEIDYIARDVVAPLIGNANAAFGVTLGDVVWDDLSLFEPMHQVIGRIGIPWYLTIGNHDLNYDATDDRYADETWERHYGPATYSFDWGPAHWVVLDNVRFLGVDANGRPQYRGEFGLAQLEWLKRDLALVPDDQLVVCTMHIPAPSMYKNPNVIATDAKDFYGLLSGRKHVLTMSAHLHMAHHMFVGPEDGWAGDAPHHHFNAGTVCGSWWTGAPDEQGIPHATMRDGCPNGHYVLKIDGANYRIEFVPARRPATDQLGVWLPDEVEEIATPGVDLVVNVYAGSDRSTVEFRIAGETDWRSMPRVDMLDPFYVAMKELENSDKPPAGRRLPPVMESKHIWKASLGAKLKPGTHLVEVRTVDMFGQTYEARRTIRVKPSAAAE
jgi:hypothetical protein